MTHDPATDATPPAVPPGTWLLDAGATTVELRTRAMWGMVKVDATFAATAGSAHVAEDGTVTGLLTIDAASIDTRQKKRDEHLRSADFFDVAAHPTFTYAVDEAPIAADGTVLISGTFSAHGVTRPLDVRATVTTAGTTLTVDGEADLDRSKWGIGWTKMGARLDNHIKVRAVLIHQP